MKRTLLLCGLVPALVLAGACGGSSKKETQKVTISVDLSADQCTQIRTDLTTLSQVPTGNVEPARATAAVDSLTTFIGRQAIATQTVLVAVTAINDAPADQRATTASTITTGGGYQAALDQISAEVDKKCG